MIKRRFAMLCLLVVWMTQAALVFAQQGGIARGKLPLELDKLMAAYTTAGLFNGSVLVSMDGRILLEKGYGYSNLETGTLNTAATKYPTYSITKSMTAALILQLADSNMLRLEDPLSRFYPDLPGADSITIAHLLTHTSGLYAYNNDYSMPTGSEEAILGFLAARTPGFRPGSQWQYCNTGYYLLGFIVEKLTGQLYGDALASRLFRTLKMYDSGLDFRGLRSANKSTGYRFLYPDSGKVARLYAQEELRSAGGVWSTVGDLFKFHEGMQACRIISAVATEKSYTIYQHGYGYGWFIDTVDKRQVVSHSGGAAGFRSLLVRIPENNTCVALLANAENMDLDVVKEGIMQVLSGKPVQYPFSVAVDDSRLSAISGTYQLEQGRSLYVYQVKHRLVAQVSGQRPVLLLADSSGRFLVAGMDACLAFSDSPVSSSPVVTLCRKGRRYTGEKINASWGIAGDALPGGWSGPDVPLSLQEHAEGVWIAKSVTLRDGAIKFRFNNDWTFNLGTENGMDILVEDGADIKVSAGTYTITLKLQDLNRPVFTMQRE